MSVGQLLRCSMTPHRARARPAFGLLSRAWIGLIGVILGGFLLAQSLDGRPEPTEIVIAEMALPERLEPAPAPIRLAETMEPERFAPPPVPVEKSPVAEPEAAPAPAEETVIASVIAPPPPRVKPEAPVVAEEKPQPVVQPALANAAPIRPRIAIVLAGLGLDADATEQTIRGAPPAVALSFAPYAAQTPQWTKAAAGLGHEIGLEIPMEATRISSETLGPAVLLTSRSPQDNIKRLDWMLTRSTAFSFATPYLGDAFRVDAAAMAPVASRLQQAGLTYLEDPKPTDSAAAAVYDGSSAPWRPIDRVLTTVDEAALTKLEIEAKETGAVLVKAPASLAAITAIQKWSKGLPERGVDLVPPSRLMTTTERAI